MDDLTEFIKEIGSYNILNNLLPGAVYSFYLYFFAGINYMDINIVVLLFIMYFEGLIMSRIGSLLEPYIIKSIKAKSRDYKSYVEAEKVDPKIQILQRDANMYRTLMSVQLVSILSFFALDRNILTPSFVIAMVLGFLVFTFSYKKQRDYIINRIDIALKKAGKNKENL